jgi:hypothetical protein
MAFGSGLTKLKLQILFGEQGFESLFTHFLALFLFDSLSERRFVDKSNITPCLVASPDFLDFENFHWWSILKYRRQNGAHHQTRREGQYHQT